MKASLFGLKFRFKELHVSVCKVLLADDHQIVLEGIKSLLDKQDEFEVLGQAANGKEALEKTGRLRPDIVVMDVSMPDLDGVEAARRIKKDFPSVDVVIFSMYSNPEYIVALFKAGISGYVLKDSGTSDLLMALRAVKSGGTYFNNLAPQTLMKRLDELEKTCDEDTPLDCLSKKERQVFKLLADGVSIKSAADRLSISPKTVESYKYRIFDKLEARTITDLTKLAIRYGEIEI